MLFSGDVTVASQPPMLRPDTWLFDGLVWTPVNPTNVPPARRFAAMATWSGASPSIPNGACLMFGGEGTFGRLDDLWAWNGTGWQLIPIVGLPPPARARHCLTYDSRRNRLVLFGGIDSGGVELADTWEFDGISWIASPSPTAPSARRDAALSHDWLRGRTLLHGGRSATAVLADTWEYDGTWRQVQLAGSGPALAGAVMVGNVVADDVLMFGGNTDRLGRQSFRVDDLWDFSPASFVIVGRGCPGTNNLVPALEPVSTASTPRLGRTFEVDVANLIPTAGSVLMFLGTQTPSISQTLIGLTNCNSFCAPSQAFLLAPAGGSARFALAIPLNTALTGGQFTLQALASDPTLNPFGASLSDAGTGTIN